MRRWRGLVCVLAVSALTPAALAKVLLPGGQSIGVAVRTDGLVVIGASDVGENPSPAYRAGLRSGDVIRSVDGQDVDSVDELADILTEKPCGVEYVRGDEKHTASVQPARDPKDGAYRLGLWVRESTAGIGTLTYYDPESGNYGALGHAVTDSDAGIVLPLEDGAIYENQVIGVEKGKSGQPGEIIGQFYDGGLLGDVRVNNPYGIFGHAEAEMDCPLYPEGLETASRDQVHTGKASILTTVNGEGPREYACEIVKVSLQRQPEMRSMVLKMTDPALLSATGGIVQGMSGSPILQDGRIVGAVTHVYVDEADMGYGIFIDWMLETEAA